MVHRLSTIHNCPICNGTAIWKLYGVGGYQLGCIRSEGYCTCDDTLIYRTREGCLRGWENIIYKESFQDIIKINEELMASNEIKQCRICKGYPIWVLYGDCFKLRCSDNTETGTCTNITKIHETRLEAIGEWQTGFPIINKQEIMELFDSCT